MKDYDVIKDIISCSECGEKLSRVWEKPSFSVEMHVGYNQENNIVSKWQG